METSKPNAFAILPANVRYDESLMPNAKLLYAEITALCHKEGYCWATNAYFASLYGVSIRAVQNWLKALKQNGYITYELSLGEDKEDTVRKIYLNMLNQSSPHEEKFIPPMKKSSPPHEEIFTLNNKRNITNNNICAADSKVVYPRKQFKKPTLSEVREYIKEKHYSVDAVKFYEYYEAGDWHDAKGKPVKNWKQRLVTWNGRQQNDSYSKPKETNTWVNPKPTDEALLEQVRQMCQKELNDG